tara:strand:+ start:2577 stop:3959 length:1383 start_codon:yes stop_codon:yes gene_type:complete
MAVIRRAGFGSVFEVENETVGIGTTGTATNTLQVLGETKTSDAAVVGISTLTTYQGFVDKEARFPKGQIDNQSQSGSLSGEIIIEGDVIVSSASTFTSSINQLSVTNSLSVPTGDTFGRIHCKTAGSMRFNEELATLEFYTGDVWKTVNSFSNPGRGRGIFAGGRVTRPGITNIESIEQIDISTLGDSINFGNLTATRRNHGNCSSSVRGLVISGSYSGSPSNSIDYFALASEGNGQDFGDATASDQGESAVASSTRGVHATGNPSNKTIDYVEIATLGNALDFGDRVISLDEHGAIGSATRGLFCGGGAPSGTAPNATMQLITIASKGDATTFGDLTETRGQLGGGVSDGVRGVVAGGHGSPATKKGIDYVTFASEGNATHFGDLSVGRAEQAGAASNRIRGVFAGGTNPNAPGTYLKSMEFITIATTGNSQFFGDLTSGRERIGGGQISDSHGGLGGF